MKVISRAANRIITNAFTITFFVSTKYLRLLIIISWYSAGFNSIFQSKIVAVKKVGRFSEIIFEDNIFLGFWLNLSTSLRKVIGNAFHKAHARVSQQRRIER